MLGLSWDTAAVGVAGVTEPFGTGGLEEAAGRSWSPQDLALLRSAPQALSQPFIQPQKQTQNPEAASPAGTARTVPGSSHQPLLLPSLLRAPPQPRAHPWPCRSPSVPGSPPAAPRCWCSAGCQAGTGWPFAGVGRTSSVLGKQSSTARAACPQGPLAAGTGTASVPLAPRGPPHLLRGCWGNQLVCRFPSPPPC